MPEIITPDGRVEESKVEEVKLEDASKGANPPVDNPPPDNKPDDKPDDKLVDDNTGDDPDKTKEKEININDFLAAKDEPLVVDPTEKKVDDKKEEEPEVVKVVPDKKKGKEERDVSDLDEEYQGIFKKDMSNEAYAKLKPIVKEVKILKETLTAKEAEIENLKKGAIPESYYDNPRSVFITPEFESISTAVEKSQIVANHWKKQLIAVKKGDNKFQFLDTDDNGQFVAREVDVTDDTETELQELLTFANNQTQKFQGKMESLIENHGTKVKEALGTIKEFNSKVFPVFDDPEKGKVLKPLVEDTMKKFPSVFRKNPLLESLARAIVTTQKLAEIIKNGQAPDPKKAVKVDKKKSGPTAGEATGGGGEGNGKPEVTIDMFEAVKNG